MTELGPQARALLDAARAGMSPDAAAVRRMRAKLGVATGGAAAGAIGAKLAIAKLVVALVGASAVIGGGWYVARGPARTSVAVQPAVAAAPATSVTPTPSNATATAAADTGAPPTPVVPDADLITIEPASPISAPRHAVAPAPVRPAPHRGAVRAQPAPPARVAIAASAAPPRPALDLAHEVELVDQAMAALRRGDTRGALEAVQRHALETGGHGQLAEDAAAIEIEALCRRRDGAAAAKLAAFDARFPRSAQRARLAAQCP